MGIRTRLTEFFGIEHPIVLAPLALAGGAALTSTVADTGTLALLGGVYGDREWFTKEYSTLIRKDIGCGFSSFDNVFRS